MTSDIGSSASLSDEDALWQLLQAKDGQEQASLLANLCRQDRDQEKRLGDLLRHQSSAERFFGALDGELRAAPNETPGDLASTPTGTTRDFVAVTSIKRLGDYRLERVVGRGGMGVVFYAEDEKLGREVAIKIPRMDLMFLPGLEQRFLREAQATARLDHPNLVSILQVGTEGPVPYIATQWCDNGDLSTWMQDRGHRCGPDEAASFMAEVADGIQHCHDCGVVHLDLKPSNILLSLPPSGQANDRLSSLSPKVTDFGLARLLESQLDKSSTSMFLGTPLYMAPEQAECKRELIGPASDVFAMGVVLHELVSGVKPFDGDTITSVLDQIRQAGLPKSSELQRLPRDLRTVIARCLQKEPADRYESAGMLAADLRRFAASKPIHAHAVPLTRQFWLWCSRPERITQAGAITVAIQVTVLGNLYSHFILQWLGYRLPMKFDSWTFFQETIPVALFPHIPLLINGFRTIRRKRWSMLIGTTLSSIFSVILFSILLGQKPSFSAYEGEPLATYIAHLFIFCLSVIQLAVHMLAVPAARKEHLS